MSYKEISNRIQKEKEYQHELLKLMHLGYPDLRYAYEASHRRVKYLTGKL